MGILGDNETAIRFLHILAGLVWMGMLYFFNLVNLPLLKFPLKKPYEANMAEKITAHIAVKTLFWFRWGAVFTVLFGLVLFEIEREAAAAAGVALSVMYGTMRFYAIGMGMLLGLVMAFNVWFVIWPRQTKILTNNKAAAATTDEAEKKRLADVNAPLLKGAVLASRVNTWLSIPMLWGMVFGAHGYSKGNTLQDWYFPIAILAAVLLMMWAYSSTKKKAAA